MPLTPALLYLGSLFLYLQTAPPSIYSMDSGEFVAAAFCLGVAHPPGYPLYLLLLKLFLYLPLSSPAFAANTFSAVFGALGVTGTYYLFRLVASYRPSAGESRYASARADPLLTGQTGARAVEICASFCALLFGLGLTFWHQALVAEQYTLHVASFILVLFSLLKWASDRDGRFLFLAAFAGGLALVSHPIVVGFTFVILFFIAFREPKTLVSRRFFTLVFFFLTGLAPAVFLPLRAAGEPQINWGRADTWPAFLDHVTLGQTREMFRGLSQLSPQALAYPLLGPEVWHFVYLLFPLFFLWWLPRNRRFRPERIFPATGTILSLVCLYVLLAIPWADPSLQGYGKDYLVSVLVQQTTLVLFPLVLLGGARLCREKPVLFFFLLYIFVMAVPYSYAMNLLSNNPVLQERHRVAGYLPLSLFAGWALLSPVTFWLRTLSKMGVAAVRFQAAPLFLLLLPFWFHFSDANKRGADFVYRYALDLIEPLPRSVLYLVRRTENVFPLWYLQQVESVRPDAQVVFVDALSSQWYVDDLSRKAPALLPEPPRLPTSRDWTLEALDARSLEAGKIVREIVEGQIGTRPIAYTSGADPLIIEALAGLVVQPAGLHFNVTAKGNPLDSAEIEANLRRYRHRGIEALRPFREKDWIARTLATAYANVFFRLAEQKLAAGAAGDARLWLEEALELSPGHPQATTQLALIYDLQGQTEKALALRKQLVEAQPNDCTALNALAASHEKMYRHSGEEAALQQAAELLLRATSLCPEYPSGWLNLGRAQFQLRQPFRALESLARAASLAPLDPDILLTYALLLHDLRGGPDGRRVIEEVQSKYPKQVAPKVALARFLLETGSKDEAAEEIARLSRAYPDHPLVKQLLQAAQAKEDKNE